MGSQRFSYVESSLTTSYRSSCSPLLPSIIINNIWVTSHHQSPFFYFLRLTLSTFPLIFIQKFMLSKQSFSFCFTCQKTLFFCVFWEWCLMKKKKTDWQMKIRRWGVGGLVVWHFEGDFEWVAWCPGSKRSCFSCLVWIKYNITQNLVYIRKRLRSLRF